jgi:hypothetical protein
MVVPKFVPTTTGDRSGVTVRAAREEAQDRVADCTG